MKYFALLLMLPTAVIVGLFGIFYKELYKKPIFKNGWFLVIFNLLIWLLIGLLIFRWIL